MNEFRLALEAYLAGRIDIESLENTLRTSLQRQPHLAAAHSAVIEAMFRSQRIGPPARDLLNKIVQSAGQAVAPPKAPAPPPQTPSPPVAASDKTQFRMPATPPAPPPPPAESSDKTQFRMPSAPPPAPSPVESSEKTQFRMPRPGPPRAAASASAVQPSVVPQQAAAPAPASSADRTQLRARPVASGNPLPATPAAEVAPPPKSAPATPPAPPRATGAQAAKPGLLSDLLGVPDVGEPPEPLAVGSPPDAQPPVSSPQTTTGSTGSFTGPTTGTGMHTGTSPSTGRRTGTGTGSGSGGSWSNLATSDGHGKQLGPGDTIKDRFVLEDIIGKGGMGIVFRARDLRWEEAQDRNPYVAVKVLNEDFKRHPESLKALQRESRKAQNLAHPNVVTVYQFDRDGANVFMVMELLEGEPIDRLIKRHDAGGLPPKSALKYTAHMARALAYAHEQGIVHSDFKPANAYMTRDGIVKVFDFGISRAAKRSDKVSGSMTLFDPGTLGALTPAYASCEMIEGLEPDPRDDIYALACTFYELLTGRHPFAKQSAVQARDAKMVPAPVPGLSRSQWRGLTRGLAFNREQRSPTVMEFLNDVSPRRSSPVRWVAIAAGVAIVVIVLALFLPGYLERRRIQQIAEIFSRGDQAAVTEALQRMAKLSPEEQGNLLNYPRAREGLLSFFEKQIDAATDESKQKYDYTRAFALIAQADSLIPDSALVQSKKGALVDRQSDLVNRLSRRFDNALARGWLIDKQNPENTSVVLAILAQVQPKHALLTDQRRLVIAYAEQAGAALDRSNAALADELIAAGLKLAPQDTGLKDLGDRVRVAAARQQSQQRVRALRASIDTSLGTSPPLEAFDRKRAELAELRSVAPDDVALERWQGQMQTQLDRRLTELANARSFTDAEALLGRYAELASAAYVADRRDSLSGARKGFTDRLLSLNDALLAAIRAGRLGPPGADNARSIYQSLERSGATAEQLAAARNQISQAYVQQARDLRSKGAFADARKQVKAGLDFGPGEAVAVILRDEYKEIDDSEQMARVQADRKLRDQLAAQRAKEDNEFKAQLAAALKVPRQTIDGARNALVLAEKLRNRKVSEPMVVNAARDVENQLVAEIRATNEKSGPEAAIRFAEQARELIPDSAPLSAQLATLRKASADRQTQERVAAIATIKSDLDAMVKAPKLDDKWYRDVNVQLRRLAGYVPDSDPYVVGAKRSMSNAYIAAARKSRDAKSLSEAERFIERAAEFTPNHPDLANERKLLVDARASQGRAAQQAKLAANTDALKQRLLDEAKANDPNFLATLNALKQTLPETDVFLREDAPYAIAQSYMRLATSAARRGSLDQAVTMLDKGLETAPKLVALRNMRTLYANLLTLSEQINSGSSLSGKEVRAGLDALARSDAARNDPGVYADVAKRFLNLLDTRIRREAGRNAALAANFESAKQVIFPAERTAASRPVASGTANQTSAAPVQSLPAPASPAPAPEATTAASSSPGAVAPEQVSVTGGLGLKPCQVGFKGLGGSPRAVCYDSFAGNRGPDLVVIPSGGPFANPVAVMRYEVTNDDYNFYCSTTGRCKTVSAVGKLPIVSVGVAEAERYAAWLTDASGKVYRLPTDAEWTYIATGVPARGDLNCTVEVGGSKVRGYGLTERNSGAKTGWGVYNIVGNAQEWARAPGGWVARGGAFSDNISSCTAALGRAHSGAPDGKTGFRLVREF